MQPPEPAARLRLLICLPEESRSEHGLRAWLAGSALIEEADVSLMVGDRGSIGEPEAALVFNRPDDLSLMGKLHATGVPIIYSLGPGALIGDRFSDPNTCTPDFRTDRRIKMQLATWVHVDTHDQARAAGAHYGMSPRWMVLPPASELEYTPRERQKARNLLLIGPVEQWDAFGWCSDHGLQLLRYEDEYHILNEAARRSNAVALWARRSHYGERLLALAATGTPLAAIRCGILPDGKQAEWFEDDPTEALDRCLVWDQRRIDEQGRAAAEHSWRCWAQSFLRMVQCDAPS